MDPFAVVVIVGLVVCVGLFYLLGRHAMRGGGEPLGMRSAREIYETREALEAEDLTQMLDAHNSRRRARGESELTVGDVEHRVMEDAAEQRRRRDEYFAERELDELLEATNARRRKRGLPERTRDEALEEFGRKD